MPSVCVTLAGRTVYVGLTSDCTVLESLKKKLKELQEHANVATLPVTLKKFRLHRDEVRNAL